jgi:CheY-like chemotaxis protein
VDDDPDLLLQFTINLEKAGYRVVTASSEKEARQALADHSPDAAVLDLMMENMDSGFVLAHHIKKATNPPIPVIMVTGVTRETGMAFDASTAEERSWIKADAFLAKPIRFEQLLKELTRLLGK